MIRKMHETENIRRIVGRSRPRAPLDQLVELNEFMRRIAPEAWKRDNDDEPIRKVVGQSRPR